MKNGSIVKALRKPQMVMWIAEAKVSEATLRSLQSDPRLIGQASCLRTRRVNGTFHFEIHLLSQQQAAGLRHHKTH